MNLQKLFSINYGHANLSLLVLALIALTNAGCVFAQSPQTNNKTKQSKVKEMVEEPEEEKTLVGRWQSSEATVEIRANNTLTINGEEYSYKVKGSTLTVSGTDGSLSFPFELDGDTLIVTVEGREVVYTRQKGGRQRGGNDTANTRRQGGVLPELVGKWCYLSNTNLNSTNYRISSRCFVLHQNGTYEYSAETSSSGDVASSVSQENDSGRWSATANSITAISNSQGEITYSLEKRNHPKNGDPMLIVDGDAYVTYYQKQPW